LRDVYADASIASLLGFKGGTCAYFFYDLPRFSVDLDFDLLTSDESNQKLVFETVRKILEQHGQINGMGIPKSGGSKLNELSWTIDVNRETSEKDKI
jgi:predicted nucleotidyltransferase component of viral defense system